MPRIQKVKKPLRKPTTTKQKLGKAKGGAKQPVKAPRKALGASQSPSKPLPTPQAKATPNAKLGPSSKPLEKGTKVEFSPILATALDEANKTLKKLVVEPPKSELELLIETVNHKHMDTIRLGKAFVASALEVEAALDKASKRAAGVGWELRGMTAVSEVDKSVYRRVGLAKTERIANLASPISRANLSEVLRVMQDLGLQIQED
jgi:hypothetical protein